MDAFMNQLTVWSIAQDSSTRHNHIFSAAICFCGSLIEMKAVPHLWVMRGRNHNHRITSLSYLLLSPSYLHNLVIFVLLLLFITSSPSGHWSRWKQARHISNQSCYRRRSEELCFSESTQINLLRKGGGVESAQAYQIPPSCTMNI